MNNIEELHDGGAVVGDGDIALVIVNELVHATWAEGGPDDVSDGGAGVDVADELRLPLRGVRSLLQKYDLRLLLFRFIFTTNQSIHTVRLITETQQLIQIRLQRARERERAYQHTRHCYRSIDGEERERDSLSE